MPLKQTKKPSYPASLSQRDAQEKAMGSAYKGAMNSGKLGIGFGGIAPKATAPMKALSKMKK